MFVMKQKVVMPLTLLVSLLATLAVYRYLQGQQSRAPAGAKAPQTVLVAAQDLAVGVKIAGIHVKAMEWPRELLPAGTFSDTALVSGRITRVPVVAGEPILDSKLAPQGSGSGFSSLIPPGMRALTVSVNVVSGVSGFILPDARVDVLVTVASPNNKEESKTKIILEDVLVLAVDQTFEREDDDPVKVQSVTLLVDPGQAEKLALASSEGKLQLVLRNSADRDAQGSRGVQLRELINGAGSVENRALTRPRAAEPAAAVAPPPARTVEVLRSSKREEISFVQPEKAAAGDRP
ncbi:MAG TPA: Flp pilus assembly protein CpaB [bacterium]|nr:Flp pilus assembly protein CpaB [bacterium]HQG44716.1 Flp pilus assembly protein CpaB [bacterium]HQI49615.1 Flp pilus assembly protein CpaB [bacterium]HQJ63950.1 Flp pilus assembly protein CpaB [bacterium]